MTKTSPGQFMRQVRQEIGKVTWPTRNETFASTSVVIVMVAIAAFFFFFVDNVIGWAVKLILGLGG